MKIYTGTGDRGKTSLFSGERVAKTNNRIEAYGDLDELNSIIGALIASLPADCDDLIIELQQIQSDIFMISAWLATTANSPAISTLEMDNSTCGLIMINRWQTHSSPRAWRQFVQWRHRN